MLVSDLLRCTTLVSGWQINGFDLYHCDYRRMKRPRPDSKAGITAA